MMNTTTFVMTQIQTSIHINICATTHSQKPDYPWYIGASRLVSRNQQSVLSAKVGLATPTSHPLAPLPQPAEQLLFS